MTGGPATPGIETVFLDAGGVLVHPNWVRVAEALARHGVAVDAERLIAAEPRAKLEMDRASLMAGTDDRQRGWIYFDTVLRHAGIVRDEASERALAEMRAYHDVHNLWEHVPADVAPALAALRAAGVRLVVVSNANGTLRALFDRVGLTAWFDVVLDSHEWGVEKPDPAAVPSGAGRERRRRRERRCTSATSSTSTSPAPGRRGWPTAVLFDPAGLVPTGGLPARRTAGRAAAGAGRQRANAAGR